MINSLIPVVESEDKQERWDIYSRLLKDRIIYLFDEVTNVSSSLIVAQLLYLESIGADKQINFYINSPGGSITAGMQIFDTIKTISCPVSTIGVGQCASMGSFLLSAGDKGLRFALPSCEIMIHQPLGGFNGQATDIDIHAERILAMRKYLNKCYCVFTGQPLSKIEKDTERDNFMTAKEAEKYGLIDKVLVKNKMAEFLAALDKVA